jgi:hypothetical protein
VAKPICGINQDLVTFFCGVDFCVAISAAYILSVNGFVEDFAGLAVKLMLSLFL